MPPTRRCNGKTKAGKRCKAHPLKDTDFCLAHSDEKTRGSVRFGGAQPGSGRPKLPTPTEVAKQVIEDNITVVLTPHFRTLGYELERDEVTGAVSIVEREGGGAKLHGESRDGYVRVSSFDDLAAMMTAAEKLLDRIYGRPKQQTELTGADGGPVEIVPVSVDRAGQVAALLGGTGAVRTGG